MIDVSSVITLNDFWTSKVSNQGGESQARLLEKRSWTFQALEDVFRQNSRHKTMRRFYLNRKETQRYRDRLNGNWMNWLFATGSKYIVGYGEKPMNIIYFSAFIIIMFSLAYTLSGGVTASAVEPIRGVNRGLSNLFTNIYFSIMTFTSLGYGDLQPATWSVRILSTAESILGTLLTALLIFVLGRRTVR